MTPQFARVVHAVAPGWELKPASCVSQSRQSRRRRQFKTWTKSFRPKTICFGPASHVILTSRRWDIRPPRTDPRQMLPSDKRPLSTTVDSRLRTCAESLYRLSLAWMKIRSPEGVCGGTVLGENVRDRLSGVTEQGKQLSKRRVFRHLMPSPRRRYDSV